MNTHTAIPLDTTKTINKTQIKRNQLVATWVLIKGKLICTWSNEN